MAGGRAFPRSRLASSTLDAAEALLGALLVREPATDDIDAPTARRTGRIVEVEAYLGPEDRASHARAGLTARTAPMFGQPGAAYVYLVYGMYDCLNVVTEPAGSAGAVLVRAVEPIEGAATMRRALAEHRASRRRGPPSRAGIPRHVPDHRLCAGPGLVAAAFSVDRAFTGTDLCDPGSPLRLEASPPGARQVGLVRSPRVGVAYAAEPWATLPYRFIDASSPSVRLPGGARDSGTLRNRSR